jgi:hypothetical protein
MDDDDDDDICVSDYIARLAIAFARGRQSMSLNIFVEGELSLIRSIKYLSIFDFFDAIPTKGCELRDKDAPFLYLIYKKCS